MVPRLSVHAALVALVGALGCAKGTPSTTTGAGGDSSTGGAGGSDECAGLPDGTPCGDDAEGACNQPDSCLDGVCQPNHEPEGTACGDPTDTECDPADTCDGEGSCVARIEPDGAACGDPTDNNCTSPDTCDGMGTCESNHRPLGYGCGDNTDDECTGPDTCDGMGTCLTHDEPAGTPCGDQTDDECTDPDACDGMGTCAANHAMQGTACGDQADGSCTDPDTCDGMGSCDPNHELMGVACGSPADTDCTNPDSCNGAGLCLVNHEMDGLACNDCPQGAGLCDGCAMGMCTDACVPPLDSLTTTNASGNFQRGTMFDVEAKDDITLTRVAANLVEGTHEVTIWYVPGGYAGHEMSQGDWTLVDTITGLVANNTGGSQDQLTEIPIDLDRVLMNGERVGIYVHSDLGQWFTNGTAEHTVYVQNVELMIYEGRAIGVTPFGGSQSFPRVVNGTVSYTIGCL